MYVLLHKVAACSINIPVVIIIATTIKCYKLKLLLHHKKAFSLCNSDFTDWVPFPKIFVLSRLEVSTPWAKSSLTPLFVKKVLLEHS